MSALLDKVTELLTEEELKYDDCSEKGEAWGVPPPQWEA